VLSVDTEQNRISLTLKKSLVESELPIVAQFSDASVGLVTHGVVAKLLPKSVLVKYYGGVSSFVPLREATYVSLSTLRQCSLTLNMAP
jgi:rRNA biogenesis protein RRP5